MKKVLIYNGKGAAQNGPVNTAVILRNGYNVSYTSKITQGILQGIDVLVLPGGDGGMAYLNIFTDAEEKAIKDFVYNGGNCFCTCAGAYLAAKSVYNKDVKIYDGLGIAQHVRAQAVWYEGSLTIKLKDGTTVKLSHYNGPAMKGGDVLASYADNKNGYKGYGAIVRDSYGKGRVVLCGPHPELSPQHPELILMIMDYLLQTGDDKMEKIDVSKKIMSVTKAQFINMIKRVSLYVNNHDKAPGIVYLNSGGSGDYVKWSKYWDMKKRWDAYITNNKKQPSIVWINKTTNKKSTLHLAAEKVLGTYNTALELYNRIKAKTYAGYNDDIYDLQIELKRMGSNLPLNCSDYSQLYFNLLLDMGYEARYVHIMCAVSGGHIVVDARGKELNNHPMYKKQEDGEYYLRLDPAAAASDNYDPGYYWCSNGTVIRYNDEWLMSDDGQ